MLLHTTFIVSATLLFVTVRTLVVGPSVTFLPPSVNFGLIKSVSLFSPLCDAKNPLPLLPVPFVPGSPVVDTAHEIVPDVFVVLAIVEFPLLFVIVTVNNPPTWSPTVVELLSANALVVVGLDANEVLFVVPFTILLLVVPPSFVAAI